MLKCETCGDTGFQEFPDDTGQDSVRIPCPKKCDAVIANMEWMKRYAEGQKAKVQS